VWCLGFEGFEGLRGWGVEWFDGLILLLYVYCHMVRNTMGIGFMALWGFWAKCLTGWVSGVDIPLIDYPTQQNVSTSHKVYRCLARKSPCATTTNQQGTKWISKAYMCQIWPFLGQNPNLYGTKQKFWYPYNGNIAIIANAVQVTIWL
jgi:hypothetical protein